MIRIQALVAVFALGVTSAADHRVTAPETVLFRGVRVFDGIEMLSSRDVLVQDGKVARVGQRIAAAEGARVVDGRGRTLLPGFIDSHTHAFGTALEEALVFGVTTELDMFTAVSGLGALRAQLQGPAGERMADLRTAGTLVTAPGGHGTEYGFAIPTIENPDDAQAFVDARLAEGSDYIKIVYDNGRAYGRSIPSVNEPTLRAVIAAAHQRSKLAVVHISTLASAREALEAGANGLVHLFADSMPDLGFGRLAARHGAFVVPTLSVVKSVTGVSAGAKLVEDSALAPYILPASGQGLARSFPRPSVPSDYNAAIATVQQLKAARVPILAGTDAPNPGTAHGPSMHGELELLVQAGLTPVEALRAATAAPAKAFGLTDRGTIATGQRADLVLVEGDPSRDILATRRIVGIWKAGVAVDRDGWRQRVTQARVVASQGPPVPEGLGDGTISHFDDGTNRASFGTGWELSTDRIAGGKSTGELKVITGGAAGSAGSLEIAGVIDPSLPYAWSGAMFSPGTAPFTPANISSKRAIRFFAQGDGKTYRMMIFSSSQGQMPLQQTFVAGPEWKEYAFPFASFNGITGKDVMALLWVGGPGGGDFSFRIDGVRLE
jgi:imidazolonepropionase-like amidohydrolase